MNSKILDQGFENLWKFLQIIVLKPLRLDAMPHDWFENQISKILPKYRKSFFGLLKTPELIIPGGNFSNFYKTLSMSHGIVSRRNSMFMKKRSDQRKSCNCAMLEN